MDPPGILMTKFCRRSSQSEPRPRNRLLITSVSSLRKARTMLSLPTELHARILENVSYADLRAFRGTCRTCYRLLWKGEIVRRWLESNGRPQQLSLYPPPTPPTFQYIFDQELRYRNAIWVARFIAAHIQREVLQHTLKRFDILPTLSRQEALEMKSEEVQEKLIPLILTLQHYLSHFADAVLEQPVPLGHKRIGASLGFERVVLESYHPEELLKMHKFLNFLHWLLNRLLSRRTEKAPTSDGSLREPFSRYQLRIMLVLGGTNALLLILMQETPKQRLHQITTWLRRLDPDVNLLWQRHWSENVVSRNKPAIADDARAVLDIRFDVGQVWMNGARALLMERGQLPKNTSEEFGTPWQAVDFLIDTCGYEALQTPPSMLQLSRALMRPDR